MPKRNPNPLRHILATIYNTTPAQLETLLTPHVKRATFQQEICPTTNKKHIQAYFELKTPLTLPKLKQLLKLDAHYEATRTPLKAQTYCSKEDTRDTPPVQIGEPIQQKQNNWTKIQELCLKGDEQTLISQYFPIYTRYKKNFREIIQENLQPKSSSHLRGIYIYGQPGVGKSQYITKYNPYYKQHNKWWCNYQQQKIIALEDVDHELFKWATHFLKIWTDHYPVRGETKGSFINLQHDWFILTSNHHLQDLIAQLKPIDQQALLRRFTIYHITEENKEEQFLNLDKKLNEV